MQERQREFISVKSRRKLIKCLFNYLVQEYDMPTDENIKSVCFATIRLFPSLKEQNSTMGGIVSINSFDII